MDAGYGPAFQGRDATRESTVEPKPRPAPGARGPVVRFMARLALAAAVVLSAQACGSSQTPAPSGPAVLHVVLGNAPRPISLSVIDRTSLVVAAAASNNNVPMNLKEQADFDKTQALVRAGPDEKSVTILWGSGTCTPNQAMLITPAGDGWTVQIDLGSAVGDVCDMMLISLAVTITASVPLDATRIHAALGKSGAGA